MQPQIDRSAVPPVSQTRLFLRRLAIVIAVLGLVPTIALAQGKPPQVQVVKGAQLLGRYTPTLIDVDLRNLPAAPRWRPGDPIKEIPRRHNPAAGRLVPPGPPANPTAWLTDPLLDFQQNAVPSRLARAFTTPALNFAGQGFTGVNPPDTVGDIGLNYYIQMINAGGGAQVTIYDKTTGAVVSGPFLLDSLGTGACANGFGDPIVLYDRQAQRWMLSEFCSGNCLCVYISQTADPIAGGWFNYEFATPGFPDYPKYGVWPDAYYVSTNESSPAVYALERDEMLIGGTAAMIRMTAPDLAAFGFQALIPCDLDGANPPPAGSPNYFMRHRDDEVHNPGSNDPSQDFLEIWEFSVDFDTPANSTFIGPFNIGMTEFDSDLCGLEPIPKPFVELCV